MKFTAQSQNLSVNSVADQLIHKQYAKLSQRKIMWKPYFASYSDECSVCILLLSGWLFRNDCFWICSRFGSVIRSFLPFNTVEYKSWRAVTMDCWKSAEMSFCALYGKRRIAFSLSSCHIWRHVVITGYDDHFLMLGNRLIFGFISYSSATEKNNHGREQTRAVVIIIRSF